MPQSATTYWCSVHARFVSQRRSLQDECGVGQHRDRPGSTGVLCDDRPAYEERAMPRSIDYRMLCVVVTSHLNRDFVAPRCLEI